MLIQQQHRAIVLPGLRLLCLLVAEVFWDRLQLDLLDNIHRCAILIVVYELLQLLLEAIECHHYACDIIDGATKCAGSQYSVDAMTTILMCLFKVDLLDLVFICFHQDLLPPDVDAIFTGQLVEDAVATNHDEVVVVFYFEGCDVWVCHHDVWVAFILFDLGFDITNCLGHGEPSWEHSMWAIHYLLASFTQTWICLYNLRVLIYSTTIFNNSFHLQLIRGLVVC